MHIHLIERSVFPFWCNRQFIHCSDASVYVRQRCEPNESTKYETVRAYVIKIFFFFGKIHLFQTALKNLSNKYSNFGQLLLSFVVNIDELFYKQATSYSLFESSQTPLGQSEPNLITPDSASFVSEKMQNKNVKDRPLNKIFVFS